MKFSFAWLIGNVRQSLSFRDSLPLINQALHCEQRPLLSGNNSVLVIHLPRLPVSGDAVAPVVVFTTRDSGDSMPSWRTTRRANADSVSGFLFSLHVFESLEPRGSLWTLAKSDGAAHLYLIPAHRIACVPLDDSLATVLV